jgi:hypothetical protein
MTLQTEKRPSWFVRVFCGLLALAAVAALVVLNWSWPQTALAAYGAFLFGFIAIRGRLPSMFNRKPRS